MKPKNKTKRLLRAFALATTMLLISGNPVFAQTAYEPLSTQQSGNGGAFSSEPPFAKSGNQLLRSSDPGGRPGDNGGEGGIGQEGLPISDGLWVLIGLVLAYGVFCQKRKRKDKAVLKTA